MTPETAFILASQFGSYVDQSDAGACMYSFHLNDGRPVSEAHRAQCLSYLDNVVLMQAGENDNQRAQDLREFFATTPLYTKAPLSEAGPLALRALQNIRGFLDAQTLRLDDPRKDGSGEDAKVADCFDHAALADIVMGESLSIVGPPAPIPAPATRKFYVTLIETVHYEIDVEADSEESAGNIATEKWLASQDPTHDFGGDGQGVEVLNVEPAGEER